MVVEKLEHSRVKVVFDVTANEFEKALDKAFEVNNAKVAIQGFRKGKAPRSVYEKHYGVESLFDEALNIVLDSKAEEIFKDKDLASKQVGPFEPNFESEDKLERGKDFKISLSFDVYPEVKLPKYKGLEVAKKNLEVTDEDVESAVKNILKKDAEKQLKAEQVIAKGDYATFDFVGSVDGVEFPGGKADNYELEIGSGQFIPGFEDQMIGMKSEEVKDINVTFPENYGEKTLAGKPAVFKVTVHEVKEEKLPELTDEYAKNLKIEGVSTVAELKANKKKELEDQKATSEKDRQVDALINNVLDNAVVDMPQALIDNRVNAIKNQFESQAKMYNIPFETYLSLMNITAEDFNKRIKEQGSRQALFDVVASKIIEDEKLIPTDEQVAAKAASEAERTGQNKDTLLAKNKARYANDLAYQGLIDLLLNNAKEI